MCSPGFPDLAMVYRCLRRRSSGTEGRLILQEFDNSETNLSLAIDSFWNHTSDSIDKRRCQSSLQLGSVNRSGQRQRFAHEK